MTKNRFDPKNFRTAPDAIKGLPPADKNKRKAPASSVPWKNQAQKDFGKQKFATKKAAPKKKTSSAWAVADEEFMRAQKRRKPVKKITKKRGKK